MAQESSGSRPGGSSSQGTQAGPVATPPPDPKPFPLAREERGAQGQVGKNVTVRPPVKK